jgi:hypothetical protein
MDLSTEISPVSVFGFMIAFVVGIAVICIYRGMKTKNKVFYAGSGFCGSLAFAFLVGAFGQYLLCLIIMGITAFAGLFMMPKLTRIISENAAEAKETVDTSGPIRLKDVLSVSFIIKLERKYGELKAMVIWSAAGTALAIPLIPVMVLLRITTWPIGVGVLAVGFIAGLFTYRYMKRGLYT